MSTVQLPDNETLLDLLAEEATSGLADGDRSKLEALLAEHDLDIDTDELAEAAAACTTMWADPTEDVPAECRAKLIASAEQHIAEHGLPELRLAGTPADASLKANPLAMWGGWAAAAACLVIAVVASQPSSSSGTDTLAADPQAPAALSPADQLASLAAADPAVTRASWLSIDQVPPLNAATPHRYDEGITGEVVWSEDRDQGFMRISGLTSNNPEEWVYQLWIFDKSRDAGDLTQRPVDGGVFNFDAATRDPATGDVIVPIDAKLPVGEAFLFAVTVEEPGGVVVSDRDVVFVAALG